MAQADYTRGEANEGLRVRRGEWLRGQNQAFRAALDGAPLDVSLGILCDTANAQFREGVRCAFYMADPAEKTLRHVVGMPEGYARRGDGFPISADSLAGRLACNVAAPVITPDVREEPRWAPWVELAEAYGYRGCWSFPVWTAAGEMVGTFAFHFPEPRTARPEDHELAEALTSCAAILIAQHKVRETLREREAKYRGLFESIDTGYCVIEVLFDDSGTPVDYRFLEANPAFVGQTGLTGAIGRTVREFAPDHEAFWFETYGRIARTGRAERFEHRADALDRWFDVFAFRVGDPDRHQVAVLFEDVKQRKLVDLALRESEERQTFLLKLSDALRPLARGRELRSQAAQLLGAHIEADRVYYVDCTEAGAEVSDDYARPGLPSLAGHYPLKDFRTTFDRLAKGRTWVVADVTADTALAESERACYAAQGVAAWIDVPLLKAGRLEAVLCVIMTAPRAWTGDEIALVEEVADRMWAAIERGRAEQALRESETRALLLLGELQHRVRNMLFVIRSVFTRTFDATDPIEDMAEHFRGRLDALARTQVVVTQNSRGTADLEDLIREELLSVGVGNGSRISIEGSEVELSGESAEALGLVIHELTTNSIKYGALRFPDGGLAIRWSVDVDYSEVPHLMFSWEEQGVPAMPVDPGREGFGTELITRALPYRLGAKTSFELSPGGVRCLIDLPLTRPALQRGAY